jgi:hypothetical protein
LLSPTFQEKRHRREPSLRKFHTYVESAEYLFIIA